MVTRRCSASTIGTRWGHTPPHRRWRMIARAAAKLRVRSEGIDRSSHSPRGVTSWDDQPVAVDAHALSLVAQTSASNPGTDGGGQIFSLTLLDQYAASLPYANARRFAVRGQLLIHQLSAVGRLQHVLEIAQTGARRVDQHGRVAGLVPASFRSSDVLAGCSPGQTPHFTARLSTGIVSHNRDGLVRRRISAGGR
jgi:hypothetical protein